MQVPKAEKSKGNAKSFTTGLLFLYLKSFPLPKKGLMKNEQNYCHIGSEVNKTHRKKYLRFSIIPRGLGCPTSSKRCTFYSPESISAKGHPLTPGHTFTNAAARRGAEGPTCQETGKDILCFKN